MSDVETTSASMQDAGVWVDLLKSCRDPAHSGVQWAHECEDLDMTLLSWAPGKRIEAHVNSEVDVVLIGIEGQGEVTVNGETHEMRGGVALLIPKGAERAIQATAERFSYLSLHKRRRRLMPSIKP